MNYTTFASRVMYFVGQGLSTKEIRQVAAMELHEFNFALQENAFTPGQIIAIGKLIDEFEDKRQEKLIRDSKLF